MLKYVTIFALIFLSACKQKTEDAGFYTAEDFSRVSKWDTHIHINSSDFGLIELARKLNFHLLTISVNSPGSPSLEQQLQYAVTHTRNANDRMAWATSFDISGIESDSNWLRKKIDSLGRAFQLGAAGVKVWKNIGMEYRTADAQFIMIDDPRLDSVFSFIEHQNKTLIAHIGEPKNCWLPLDSMTVNNDRSYFKNHPQYHMYLHPEFPTYYQQIAARDHVLQKHPGLRVDGAHLGSIEWNVDTLAATLDRYPQLSVDMAARIGHLQYQALHDHQKVVDFFIKYQDRLLYATDSGLDKDDNVPEALASIEKRWRNDWKFFTSDELMDAPEVNEKFKGLHLPAEVVDKIYRLNAERLFKSGK